MSNAQDANEVSALVMTIQGKITRSAGRNDQLAKPGLHATTHSRMIGKNGECIQNGRLNRRRRFGSNLQKKRVDAIEVVQCSSGKNYFRHDTFLGLAAGLPMILASRYALALSKG